jgi:hypothetical protein
MALGTVTPVRGAASTWGNKKMKVFDVQLTSGANYTTGGETLTAAQVGLRSIDQVNVLGLALTASGTTSRSVGVLYSSKTSVKLLVQTTASTEAAASSDQSTFTARIQFVGA